MAGESQAVADQGDDRFGLETAMARAKVSLTEDTQAHLLTYATQLRKWQAAQNLVGPDTLADLWTRHIADCLQLVPLIEDAVGAASDGVDGAQGAPIALDLGTGAGLPGMVLAMAFAEREPNLGPVHFHLVDSNQRKAAFLRAVSRETQTPITVHAARIDAVSPDVAPARIVTARALAPLPKLIGFAQPWLSRGAVAFFHKGGDTGSELAAWSDADGYSVVKHTSVIDPNSRILEIRQDPAPS